MAGARVSLTALDDIPFIKPGDDLASLLVDALRRTEIVPVNGDIVVVAQKIVSKAEGRVVALAEVKPSRRALAVAKDVAQGSTPG
jgi:coenzyme F420-0:L-glutamate ligase/coenzyme F420-1:gamma-L-glutamate ligase